MNGFVSSGLVPIEEMGVVWHGAGLSSAARISEISRTGAFVKTPQPPPVGTLLNLRLQLLSGEMFVQGIVRHALPGQGMGIEFKSINRDDQERLDLAVLKAERARDQDAETSTHNSTTATAQAEPSPATETPTPSRRIERRERHRYKFTAEAEVTDVDSGRRVHAHLTNLGRFGCYVRLTSPFPAQTNVELSVTRGDKVFHAQATVMSVHASGGMGLMFIDVVPEQYLVLDEWLAICMERTWLASNRRRTQRVLVNIPVEVAAHNSLGTEVFEETKTISISAHGALLQLKMQVAKGQTIVLRNPSTKAALECSVDYLGTAHDGSREVGVTFVAPNQTLWKISFPSAEWGPGHPDAKKM